MVLLRKLYDQYVYLFEDLADPRTNSLLIVNSPLTFACIIGFYLYFVLKLGPRLMKHRPPFNLEKILVAYNLAQILACFYIVVKYVSVLLFRYSLKCEPIDYSNNEIALDIVWHTWFFLLIKVADLLDTVFFILRKKTNQVSFLHVYHHTGMCILIWFGVKYFSGGHGLFLGFINSIVHIVMYFYYLLSAWDKEYKKNVWWKKHITQLQIAQFVFLGIYFSQVFFQPDCNYPKWIAALLTIQAVIMIYLFTNFYVKAYIKPHNKPNVKQNSTSSTTGENHLNKHGKQF